MAHPFLQTQAGLSRHAAIPRSHLWPTSQHSRGYFPTSSRLPFPRGQTALLYSFDISQDRRSCPCSSLSAVTDSVYASRASRAELPALPTYEPRGNWKSLDALGGGIWSWECQGPRARGLRKHNARAGGFFGRVMRSSSGNEAVQEAGIQQWPGTMADCLTAGPDWQFSNLYHDFGAMGLVLAGAFLWVKVFGYLAKQDLVERKLSRKLVHISSGLLYLACWPLFSFSPWARFVAALVPLANIVRFLIAGLGVRENEALVSSMSREGDPKELLRGPFYYVIVLMLSAIVFWRDSPVGMISLAMMCGGDGVADIVGRKYGALKLPYNPEKSWAGSVAMCTFGFLVSLGFLYYFSALGFFQLDVTHAVPRVALMAIAATIVESLPLTAKFDDNITVPLTTVLLGVVLFPYVINRKGAYLKGATGNSVAK